MKLISPEYRDLNQELHERDPDWGNDPPHLKLLIGIIRRYGIKSVLDYGCGKGAMAGVLKGIPLQLYDPAIPEFSSPPEPADLVWCQSVLEHVEFMSLYPLLNELERLTKRVAVFFVSTVPSSKTLADGRNAHLVVKPIEWWIVGLSQRWHMRLAEDLGRNFLFIGKKRK